MVQGNDLGEFLHARRDLLDPAVFGLPDHGARGVAGLRREEVALLAGVSTDYYTRLEQGRERHPSEQVLNALARALRFDAHAAAHLFRLAQPAGPAAVHPPAPVAHPHLVELLEHFVTGPATVVGPALDVLAANPLAVALYRGFARFDNLLRMVFLDPAARDFYTDWDAAARGVTSNFRFAASGFDDDPRVHAVLGELSLRSPAFVDHWSRHEVRPRAGADADKRLRHPQVGELTVRYHGFLVLAAPGQQMFVYTAEPGSPSADGLTLLHRFAPPTGIRPGNGDPAGRSTWTLGLHRSIEEELA